MARSAFVFAAVAVLASSALIVPASGLAAQNWTVRNQGHRTIDGSGRIVRQNRAVGRFNRIETVGSEEVEVRFGPRPSLVIAADDNILPLITTEVRGGTLKIGSRGSFRMRGPIKVWITTPDLDAYQSSGSGGVTIHQINNSRLGLTINGSSDFDVTGRTGRLDLAIHGSGRARLARLLARDVDASLYGSGDATVRTTDRLTVKVFGSGTVRYVGRPRQISRNVFGSGRIVAGD